MSTLGRIFFRDQYENEREVYLVDVLSLNHLDSYAQGIVAYSTGDIFKVWFCSDGYVDYIPERHVVENVSPQEIDVNYPGSEDSGLTCCEVCTCYMFRRTPPGRRAITIPAPLHSILNGCDLKPEIGEDITTLFNMAVLESDHIYRSGHLITPYNGA